MDFRRYLDFLRSQWEWIAIATVAGGVIAMSIALSATPKYAATAELFLATPGYSSVASTDNADNSPFQADAFSQQRARSYVELAARPDLAQRVVDKLQLAMSPADLAAGISARVRPDTVLIAVTVKASSPVDAQNLANAVTVAFADDIRRLETPAGMRIPNVDPVITQLAEAPSEPSDPNIAVYVLLGISLGFLAGVTGVALFRRRRVITDARMVEQAGGLPVLAVLGGEGGDREQEWNLAALAIERALPGERPAYIAVTAADGDVGESAAAVGELTSAMTRRGSLVASVDTAAELRRSADIIVIDASNMLGRSDAAEADKGLGGAIAHAVVIVVSGQVRENELRAALDRLKSQQISILGAVFTPGIRSAKSGVLQLISSNRRTAE
ncbi:Wzz/FepE/Etk N-terminal domain-containing protein [Mycobacterium sp. 2YAF39]|uniref:YveK family protein n=1 Tax=Mycobacterium sp. 2YAF39 TaxID=3233033 RepID=UPI003F9B603C